jgi:hypothetical protein
MESQASEKLNEAVTMTAVVSSKGTGKKTMLTAGVGGVAGQLLGEKLGNKNVPTSPGGIAGYMVMALSDASLAFFKMKRGLLKNSAGDLLVSVPRGSVSAFTFGGGALTSGLNIELNDGTVWALEVPRAGKGKAERIRRALVEI